VVFLAGSTQEGEEEAALAAFRQLAPDYPQLRLVLVPRHAERFEAVAALLHRSGFAWQRRSALGEVEPLEPRTANETADPVARRASLAAHANVPRILLVDTIGELSAWWGTAQVGFVGGSLGNRGGQNMIEPAAYGVAVCFGPNTWNFRDIVAALLARQAAVVVHDAAELADFVRRCLAHQAAARQLGERARALVLSQQGAAARTVALLRELAQGCHRPAGAPGAPAAPHFSTTPAPGPLPPGNTPSHVARSEGGGL
jgi:3-deoxy-D-manno-octulosonic-acid transferase